MTKEYRSKSCVSFSVNLPSGKSRRVSFSPQTAGGSVFYTADPDVQAGLENHPFFGKMFVLAPARNEVATEKKKKAETSPAKKEPLHVPYTNIPDAKDYLAINFDVPRTKVRTKDDVKNFGALHNVIFDGIEDNNVSE